MSFAKKALRQTIKAIIKEMPKNTKKLQSDTVSEKLLSSNIFRLSNRISIYLSTEDEVNTIGILKEMFRQNKEVFVPTYQGSSMEMVKLNDMDDYESLPLTKWNIKQPDFDEERENALKTGGLDLLLIPGVAFSREGGRLGHGAGYYDKYLRKHFELFPHKFTSDMTVVQKLNTNRTLLVGLAFREQIIDEKKLPLESHDFRIDMVITA